MSEDPRENIASRMARDAQRQDEERRRGPLIDFGALQLGGKSSILGIGFGWPEFLGALAFGYGIVFGRANDPLLAGLFYALLVWLPLRLLISGSQFLFNLLSKRETVTGARLPALLAWPIIGAGGGALLGALIASALGSDIAPMEGVVRFAPAGLLLGVIIGFFRRKRS